MFTPNCYQQIITVQAFLMTSSCTYKDCDEAWDVLLWSLDEILMETHSLKLFENDK